MKYLSLVFFTFVLWNCTPPTESIDLEAEKAALTTAAQNYYQLMNDHNWEGLEAIYSPSGKLIPDQKDVISGEKGIQSFVDGFKSRVNFKVSYEDLEVSLADSGDMGYSIASVTTTFQDSLGNDFGGVNRDLHIWKKENGEWKVVIDIWNSPTPLE
jgi:ketosteroid isomerase-like protein